MMDAERKSTSSKPASIPSTTLRNRATVDDPSRCILGGHRPQSATHRESHERRDMRQGNQQNHTIPGRRFQPPQYCCP